MDVKKEKEKKVRMNPEVRIRVGDITMNACLPQCADRWTNSIIISTEIYVA